jgi:hypothetical protein
MSGRDYRKLMDMVLEIKNDSNYSKFQAKLKKRNLNVLLPTKLSGYYYHYNYKITFILKYKLYKGFKINTYPLFFIIHLPLCYLKNL